MNKEEWITLLDEFKLEYKTNGVLSKESREKLDKYKAIAIEEGYITSKDLNDISKISSVVVNDKINNDKKPLQASFVNRGPRNFVDGEKAVDTKGTINRLFSYFKSEVKLLVFLFISIVLVVLCQVIVPRLQSNAIDYIDDRLFDKLPFALLLMILFFVILSIFNFVQGLLSAKLSQNIVLKMRNDLFKKIINLPISYFDSNSHGDIMSRMTNDVDNVSNTLAQSLGSLFSGVLMILGTVIMMVLTCAPLAALSCIIVILTVLVTKYLSKAMKKFFKRRQALLGRLNGSVEEMVVGHKSVAAFSKEDKVVAEFEEISCELTKAGIIAEILGGSMGPIMNCINNIGFVIIALFGGYFAYKGIISVGVISAFIIYAKQFSRPINEIAQLYGQLQTAIASSERIFAVMDEELEDNSGSIKLDNIEGLIEFKNVDFSYVVGHKVLHDFSLDIYSGHKVALVGATGSGKTTVVNLLMRFYNIQNGSILIDGKNIMDISLDNLRDNLGIVLQDTVLFNDTIRNNLKYANSNISDEEMYKASKECYCDTFIKQLKDGYDTVISEGGSNLSQGQRQLLAICRAFLADPKILILDEATSSVDTRTEKHIQDAMIKLMKNKTSLIIAHRLSTILDADLIVVMDNGRIVEMGNHEELIRKNGKYADLYSRQFAGEGI
ncbi:MAG: ABC transporter ATP-binding protein [Bacilli bacterium]|nr:ABC transporter ATP-binding protein [Bacilli bacterium]